VTTVPASHGSPEGESAPRVSAPPRRRLLVSGNWKMHHDHIEALHAVRDLGLRLKPDDVAHVDVSLHPPFTDLRTVQTLVEADRIPVVLGAQHCNDHDRGAYTGEVSPQMLARLGVRYVIVGHSERRQLFDMTDGDVAVTLRAVLRHEMQPILCIGETEAERAAGQTESRLAAQLDAALRGLGAELVAGLVVAYEPVWAIGTGNAATPVDAEDACSFIRDSIASIAGADAAGAVRIQYGGSVNPENAADYVAEPDVDGLLVGGASLEAASFVDIVRASRPATARHSA
jgi:triosephosphate isomerase